ncbi:MFS transporter [Dictyobacter arantiisoli]|uniref:MFS transporter n=1 Tax=Dictyobacter arantiisoli TaxID=2014874 RepID=A0A5A5TGI7_9CHLR|nr:MFS transporter [Dictyobacter arantiisoli]GCF10338.1 MFS transporter [Dictyobacter arantiisoli]
MSQPIAAAAQQPSAKINRRIFLLALGMFALGTDAYVVSGVLAVIAKESRVTEGLAGQLVTAFSLTYGLGSPLLAALTGRMSTNRVLIGSLGLFCLANVASALSPVFPALMVTRVLAGCFAATYAPLAYTVGISLAPPAKRGQALALVVIGLTVATALGAPLGTYVGEHFGWRMSFVLVAGLAGIAFLVLLLSGLPKAAAPSALSLKARLAPIAQPRIVLALLPSLLWNLGAYTSYTYIAPLLQQNLHILEISGLLVAFGVGVVIGNWSGGQLSDRFGPNRPLVIFLIVLVFVQIILSLATTTFVGALVILFIWGVLLSVLFIPQQHRLLSIAPEHANVILALNNSAFYLGIAGGAALGGVALRVVAVTQLNWIGAGFILLALLILGLSIRLNGRKAPARQDVETKEALLLPE